LQRNGKVSAAFAILRSKPAAEEDCHASIKQRKRPTLNAQHPRSNGERIIGILDWAFGVGRSKFASLPVDAIAFHPQIIRSLGRP